MTSSQYRWTLNIYKSQISDIVLQVLIERRKPLHIIHENSCIDPRWSYLRQIDYLLKGTASRDFWPSFSHNSTLTSYFWFRLSRDIRESKKLCSVTDTMESKIQTFALNISAKSKLHSKVFQHANQWSWWVSIGNQIVWHCSCIYNQDTGKYCTVRVYSVVHSAHPFNNHSKPERRAQIVQLSSTFFFFLYDTNGTP